MINLFVYGSLMSDKVWDELVTGRYKKSNAVLFGYQRYSIRKQPWPGLIRQKKAIVQGVLYKNIKISDLQRIDHYEGSLYIRRKVVVRSSRARIAAEVYLLKQQYRHMLSTSVWQPPGLQAGKC